MIPTAGTVWSLRERSGPVHELVAAELPPQRRTASFVRPTDRAVVLGSTQRVDDLDEARCAASGHGIERRRSGGGAVVVGPGAQLWLEVFLPLEDPLFDRDVTRGAAWLGELWLASLAESGVVGELRVHRGRMQRGPWSARCCFLGAGPGEVFLEGRKVVGLSQRRDRRGAWFFSMAHVNLDSGVLASLFRSSTGDPPLAAALDAEVSSLGWRAAAVEAALRRRLSTD